MISLAAVQGLLHALAQPDIVDEFQNVERAAQVVELPQRFLRLVLASIVAELRTTVACVTSFCASEAMMRCSLCHSRMISSSSDLRDGRISHFSL